MEYEDTLIRINSLKQVINLLKSYDKSYVEWNESGKAIAISQVVLNPIHSLLDNNTAGIVYLRGEKSIIDDVMSKLPPYVTMLQKCPAKGNRVETGADEEGNPIYVHKKLYKLLSENPEAMAIYNGFFPDYPEFQQDENGVDILFDEWERTETGEIVLVDDGSGNMIPVVIQVKKVHPRAGQMREMGSFM